VSSSLVFPSVSASFVGSPCPSCGSFGCLGCLPGSSGADLAPPAPVLSPAFVLPPSLAALPGVSFSGVVRVVSVSVSALGVSVVCSDSRVRVLRWSTLGKVRGASAVARAQAFFAGDLVGRGFRFVAAGGWSADSWFVAVVAA